MTLRLNVFQWKTFYVAMGIAVCKYVHPLSPHLSTQILELEIDLKCAQLRFNTFIGTYSGLPDRHTVCNYLVCIIYVGLPNSETLHKVYQKT